MTASALAAYEPLAAVYDAFAADYDHDLWATRIAALAAAHGVTGRRQLDVACGTGRSFVPFLRRGWEVTACDLSPAMAVRARARADQPHRVFAADMRALPGCGRFDLVTCLDDAVNYLLDDAAVAQALAAMGARLAPRGLLVFDANTLRTYRTAFSERETWTAAGHRFDWAGGGEDPAAPGRFSARLTAVTPGGETVRATHLQRHLPPAGIAALLEAAGLRCVAMLGQATGIRLFRAADDLRHTKTLVLAERAPASRRRRRPA